MNFWEKIKRKFHKYNRKTLVITVLAIILSVGSMLVCVQASVSAVKANQYALMVQTGVNNSGKDISTFIVEYRTGNDVRRAYIEPHEGAYKTSLDGLGPTASTKARLNAAGWFAYEADWKTKVAETEPLAKGSIDTYIFTATGRIDEILSIGVVPYPSAQAVTWDCAGLSVYDVKKVGGLEMAGFISDQVYLNLSGSQLAKLIYKNGKGNKSTALQLHFKSMDEILFTSETQAVKGTDATAYLQTDYFETPSDDTDDYVFKIDIADTYMAGIEAYQNAYNQKKSIFDMAPAEFLVMQVRYYDTENVIRQVNMPVLTSALGYAKQKDVIKLSSEIVDLVPQGGSLAFGAKLPQFSKLDSAKLTYISNEETLKKLTNVSSNPDKLAHHNAYSKSLLDDSFYFTGIQLYKGDNSVSVSYDGAQLKVSENAKPIYYYVADSLKGMALSNSASADIDFISYSNSDANYKIFDERLEKDQLYLVRVKTADDEEASTTDNIVLDIHYFTTAGEEVTKTVDLKEDCKEFYGYWNGPKGENIAYNAAMQANGVLYAFLELKDSVDYFSGVDFTNNGDDDWATSNFSIYRIKQKGNLEFEWLPNPTEKTNSNHFRMINGMRLGIVETEEDKEKDQDAIMGDDNNRMISIGGDDDSSDGYIYVGPKKKKSVDFNSVKITDLKIHDPDFFKYSYKMSYEYAKTNHGFNLSEMTYKVTVNVDTQAFSTNGDDDCGSNNYFYFQLVFANGTSAYVQANQQLKGDGFSSGAPETFNISVNRDYGKLAAINIIPEVDEDIGDPYDKLKIESIEVLRSLGNGFAEKYNIIVGDWIGIDYYERDATDNSHSEAELAKTFAVTSRVPCAEILFTINTGNYESDPKTGVYNQFQGRLFATIHYTDEGGESHTSLPIDVVQAMYDFDGKKATSSGTANGAISDPNLMFRQSSADRFIWQAELVDHIDAITFRAENTTETPVNWPIQSIGAELITRGDIEKDRGRNEMHQYIIDGGEYIPVTSTANESACSVAMNGKSSAQDVTIDFLPSEGSLASKLTSSDMPFIISRAPISQNDTLNVYAFLDPSATESVAATTVKCGVIYTDVYGGARQTTCDLKRTTTLDPYGAEQVAFGVKGVGAKQFGSMGFVNLKAVTGANVDSVPIDYVLVQRIRSNVVVETYKCMFAAAGPVDIAMSGIPMSTAANLAVTCENEYQDVYIQLGEMTDETNGLSAGKYDIAVALKYKTAVGEGDEEYLTEYAYLTDMNITSLKPYDMVKIRMSKPGIKEITGLEIATASYLQAEVVSAAVGTYKVNGTQASASGEQEDKYVCTNWYSFDNPSPLVIRNEKKMLALTSSNRSESSTISPITFTFKTADEVDGYGDQIGLSAKDKIRMKVLYTENGNEKVYVIDDISQYMVDNGSFGTGGSATVRMLLKGVNAQSIRSIVLTPYDQDATKLLYWGLSSVNINFGDGQEEADEKVASISDRRVFTEIGSDEENKISFANIRISGNVYETDSESQFSYASKIATVSQARDGDITSEYVEGGKLYGIDLSGVEFDKTTTAKFPAGSAGGDTLQSYRLTFDKDIAGDIEVVAKQGNMLIVRVTGNKDKDVEHTMTAMSNENTKAYVTFHFKMKAFQMESSNVQVVASAYEMLSDTEFAYDKKLAFAAGEKEEDLKVDYVEEGTLIGFEIGVVNSSKDYLVSFDDVAEGQVQIVSKKNDQMIIRVKGEAGKNLVGKITFTAVEDSSQSVSFKLHMNGKTE